MVSSICQIEFNEILMGTIPLVFFNYDNFSPILDPLSENKYEIVVKFYGCC